jgi:hypothetical protein
VGLALFNGVQDTCDLVHDVKNSRREDDGQTSDRNWSGDGIELRRWDFARASPR